MDKDMHALLYGTVAAVVYFVKLFGKQGVRTIFSCYNLHSPANLHKCV